MTDDEFRMTMRQIGYGERSFAVLRSAVGNRPLAASEQIADQLQEEIAREILAPGTHLRETALAERFGVSRGPIRDALRLLDGDALVRLSPNRGAVVSAYSANDMRQIAKISWPLTRLNLEGIARGLSEAAREEMVAAQRRIGLLLERHDPVAFALAVAVLTMVQARFVAGQMNEKILQLLYRPSIRYTVAGLQFQGAAARAAATWSRHVEAMCRRDSEAGAREFMRLLREIHLPVIRERKAP